MARFDQETYTTVVFDSKETAIVVLALSTLIEKGDFDMDRQPARFLLEDFEAHLELEV